MRFAWDLWRISKIQQKGHLALSALSWKSRSACDGPYNGREYVRSCSWSNFVIFIFIKLQIIAKTNALHPLWSDNMCGDTVSPLSHWWHGVWTPRKSTWTPGVYFEYVFVLTSKLSVTWLWDLFLFLLTSASNKSLMMDRTYRNN